MNTRIDIAAALSSVDGVIGLAYPPDVPTAGDAWPQWVQATFPGDCIQEDSYDVLVLLPVGAVRDAIDAAEALVGPVRDALTEVGYVQSVEPGRVALVDTGEAVPCLRYRLIT